MFSFVWKKALLSAVAVTTLVTGSFIAVPAVAAKAAQDPSSTPAAQSTPADQRLERLFKAENVALTRLENRLSQGQKLAARVQEFINTHQDKDVSQLQKALDKFNANLQQADGDLNHAKSVLTAHAGFDAGGKVTDRQQALATVRDAGKDLRSARRLMVQGVRELRNAIRNLRNALVKGASELDDYLSSLAG